MSDEQMIKQASQGKLSTQEIDEDLYPIFFDAISNNAFLTSDIRKGIIAKWSEAKPLVNKSNLRQRLLAMEKAHWENLELVNREGLRNKIIAENEALKEMLLQSNVSADKKANSIVLINKLSANVGQLESLAPSVEIRINTSVNEHDLSIRMNKSHLKDQGEANEE